MPLVIFDTSLYLHLSPLPEMVDNLKHSIFFFLVLHPSPTLPASQSKPWLSFVRASVAFTINTGLN